MASGFEPETQPNVLAMSHPCDNTHALDHLAPKVLHHWDDSPCNSPCAPRACCPPRETPRVQIAEAPAGGLGPADSSDDG